eukprot:278553-Rhodomonas_salina.1
MEVCEAGPKVTAEQSLPAEVPVPSAPLLPAPHNVPPPESLMSGYSLGFPPDFFEAALQHAHPSVGYHPADMWVRFTEAKLAVLQARSVSKDLAEQLQTLTAASSSAQASVRKTVEATAEMQAKI